MKVNLIFRNANIGHSIERVFKTIEHEFSNKIEMNRIELPRKGSMPWDVLLNNTYYFKKREGSNIHHVTGHVHDIFLSLLGKKSIHTFHDLVFLDNTKNPIKKAYKWLFWFYLPIKLSDHIVCISNHTKQNILSKVKTNKISVIHNAIDTKFSYVPKKFNAGKPRILHIGTGWNKNLDTTVLSLKNISCHLRIIGKLSETQKEHLRNHQIEYSNTFGVSNTEMIKEYTECDIVNFPSKYEGFGMPIIEAQATGRIVITSNINPMTEIAGEGAVFVVPNDEESLRKAYLDIIQKTEFRDEVINKGFDNVKRFNSVNIANQYLKLYNQVLS